MGFCLSIVYNSSAGTWRGHTSSRTARKVQDRKREDLSPGGSGRHLCICTDGANGSELANKIERIRLEADLSVDELLDDLRKQRERYNQEKYGK